MLEKQINVFLLPNRVDQHNLLRKLAIYFNFQTKDLKNIPKISFFGRVSSILSDGGICFGLDIVHDVMVDKGYGTWWQALLVNISYWDEKEGTLQNPLLPVKIKDPGNTGQIITPTINGKLGSLGQAIERVLQWTVFYFAPYLLNKEAKQPDVFKIKEYGLNPLVKMLTYDDQESKDDKDEKKIERVVYKVETFNKTESYPGTFTKAQLINLLSNKKNKRVIQNASVCEIDMNYHSTTLKYNDQLKKWIYYNSNHSNYEQYFEGTALGIESLVDTIIHAHLFRDEKINKYDSHQLCVLSINLASFKEENSLQLDLSATLKMEKRISNGGISKIISYKPELLKDIFSQMSKVKEKEKILLDVLSYQNRKNQDAFFSLVYSSPDDVHLLLNFYKKYPQHFFEILTRRPEYLSRCNLNYALKESVFKQIIVFYDKHSNRQKLMQDLMFSPSLYSISALEDIARSLPDYLDLFFDEYLAQKIELIKVFDKARVFHMLAQHKNASVYMEKIFAYFKHQPKFLLDAFATQRLCKNYKQSVFAILAQHAPKEFVKSFDFFHNIPSMPSKLFSALAESKISMNGNCLLHDMAQDDPELLLKCMEVLKSQPSLLAVTLNLKNHGKYTIIEYVAKYSPAFLSKLSIMLKAVDCLDVLLENMSCIAQYYKTSFQTLLYDVHPEYKNQTQHDTFVADMMRDLIFIRKKDPLDKKLAMNEQRQWATEVLCHKPMIGRYTVLHYLMEHKEKNLTHIIPLLLPCKESKKMLIESLRQLKDQQKAGKILDEFSLNAGFELKQVDADKIAKTDSLPDPLTCSKGVFFARSSQNHLEQLNEQTVQNNGLKPTLPDQGIQTVQNEKTPPLNNEVGEFQTCTCCIL